MKKWTALLCLLLCAAMLLPCTASAQSYIPGAAAAALVKDVLQSGRMLRGDMTLSLDADAALLGLDEEEHAVLAAVCGLLERITLSAAAGRTENGVRLELGASLENPQGGTPIAVDAAANLSLEGVSLESSLIEGRKVTSRWETLMAMAGMNDGDIMMLISLRDMDWEAMLPQLLAAAQEYMQLAASLAMPYMETLETWVNTLPISSAQDVPAENGYPAAAREVTVTVTQKDLGVLITRIAEQLKGDETLCQLLDMVIQEASTDTDGIPTAAQLCDEVIASAADMTDTASPLVILAGFNASGMPLYAQTCLFSGEHVVAFADVLHYTDETGLLNGQISLLTFDSEGQVTDGAIFLGTTDGSSYALESVAYSSGEQVMAMQYALTPSAAEGSAPGLVIDQNAALIVDDGTQHVQATMTASTKGSLTEDGGELIDEVVSLEITADEKTLPMTALETAVIYPTEDGLHGSYSARQTMPAAGINSLGLDVILSSPAYDAAATAALRETAFETSSRADIDELTAALTEAAQQVLLAAQQALPQDVREPLGL